MKGYEDIAAGIMLLIVILVGGYTYMNSEVRKQKEVLQIPQKHTEVKTFESLNKRTE